MLAHIRPPVLLSYAAFIVVGINVGATGVLLLAQMGDYGVSRAVIGISLFAGSAGFVLAGLHSGTLIARLGMRGTLVMGAGGCVLAQLSLATRPPFAVFMAVQLVIGYASGILESALNSHLAALPDATTLLNRLHAFFGVGALLGPVLAAWIVGLTSWRAVCLVVALSYVPLVAGFAVAYPGRQSAAPDAVPAGTASAGTASAGTASAGTASVGTAAPSAGGLLATALRDRGVLAGSALLAVYVGIELGVGSWAFSYLVQGRGLSQSLAGYVVSGYWLGLTVGRFVISPVAARLGAATVSLMYFSLTCITAAALLAWLVPSVAAASAALVLLGFFLGPVFPTTMAVAPLLTSTRLAPTAIGVMNAGSGVGGALLPWLAGAITQGAGIGTLFPFAVTLAALQFAAWRPVARRIRAHPPGEPEPGIAG
jgi:fucose permease